jgi:predicted HD phosphohydrolase
MKLTHLTMRFFGALSPAAPRPADVKWAETILSPAIYAQWKLQPRHDQRHTVRVARRVKARLAGTPDADDSRWLAAALLHDIGKLDARLGVYGRVVATVSDAATGGALADAWSEKRGFTRRVGLYLRHPEIGADRIRLAGGPEEAAQWAAAHHDPERWDDLDVPPRVVEALAAADRD